jgi:vacuolar protein sorting-associated protein VTA1
LNIWGAPDEEILAKIRYAKWNAVRITKAIKEGKDPNESNPKQEPAPQEDVQPLDPNDPEVQKLSGQPARLRQASVEDVPDEQDRIESRLAAQSIVDQSLHPSAEQSARASPGPAEKFDPYPRSGFPYNVARDNDVSPLEPAEPLHTSNDRTGSIGGGYFPEVPTLTLDTQPSTLPTAPPDDVMGHPPTSNPQYPPPGMSTNKGYHITPQSRPEDQPPAQPQNYYRPIVPPQQPFPRQAPTPAFVPAAVSVPAPAQSSKQQVYNTDDAAIAKAQKHARFAISALNFDDAATAVKELRAALQTLGAQ